MEERKASGCECEEGGVMGVSKHWCCKDSVFINVCGLYVFFLPYGWVAHNTAPPATPPKRAKPQSCCGKIMFLCPR